MDFVDKNREDLSSLMLIASTTLNKVLFWMAKLLCWFFFPTFFLQPSETCCNLKNWRTCDNFRKYHANFLQSISFSPCFLLWNHQRNHFVWNTIFLYLLKQFHSSFLSKRLCFRCIVCIYSKCDCMVDHLSNSNQLVHWSILHWTSLLQLQEKNDCRMQRTCLNMCRDIWSHHI